MSEDLSLLPSEEAEDLRAAVRAVLADRCDPAAVTAVYDGDRAVVEPLWRALALDLGLAGLLVPEAHGGHGATARDAAVVLEELGAAVAPVPFLTSSVVATSVLVGPPGHRPGDDAAALLGALAGGSSTAALVVPWTAASGDRPALPPEGGVVRSVAGAVEADVLLVPVARPDGVELRRVAATDAAVEPVVSLDMTRQLADVTVAGPALAAAPVVLADAGESLDRALVVGAALLASEQAGLSRWCLTTTVTYLRERRQFGRVVGGFQALKHRLADLYVDAEQASAAAAWAAATAAEVADEQEVAVAAAVAASYCSEVAVRAAEEALQLHGGIAMTWEHPVHLALKRAKSDQLALGSPERRRQELAVLVDLPGPVAAGRPAG